MTTLTGRNTAEKIYNFLIDNGFTPAGAAGTMANLNAESGLKPNNLQDRFEYKLGSDTYYTSSINDGTYTKDQFINDKAGYGLAQWTYFTRKRGLYEATVELGMSIADLGGQLEFLLTELKAYKSLYSVLRTSNDVEACCDKFLKEFENPAILNYKDRRTIAWRYYKLYANGMPNQPIEGVNPDTTEYETYVVEENDSWWGIASKKLGSGTRMTELAKLNGMTTSSTIYPNMVLKLPMIKQEVIQATTKPPATIVKPTTNRYSVYIVKPNDSWWSIAKEKLHDGTKMHELAKYNATNINHTLHPGDKIKIPVELDEKNNPTEVVKTHTVRPGEGWWQIAEKELGSGSLMVKLAEYNGKTIKDTIHTGNIIKIPNLKKK